MIYFRLSGLHLLELIITLTIISILTTAGINNYSHYITQAKRAEATQQLSRLALYLERYFQEYDTYQGATLALFHIPEILNNGLYRIHITELTHDAYTIEAKPLKQQAQKDNDCGNLSLNSLGIKQNSGQAHWEKCWQA